MTHASALALLLTIAAALVHDSALAQAPAPNAPATQAAPASDGTSSGSMPADYSVGASDVLKITVFNEDKLSGLFRVDTDGTITYPMLGRLRVAGQTSRDVEGVITKLLEDGYVRRPTVAVEVQEFRSRTIFILGQVRNAGKYPLQGELNIVEALSMAGSLTPDASKDVRVLRPRGTQPRRAATLNDTPPDSEIIRIDLREIENGNVAANIMLQDGDTIIVPNAERFFIIGHVRSPGSYVIEQGMTVQQAIAVAGGLTDRGSNRRLKVKREDPKQPGAFIEVEVRLTDRVQPGDTVIVPQRLI